MRRYPARGKDVDRDRGKGGAGRGRYMNGIRGKRKEKVDERGQRAYMRRTIRCNFCKAEIHILSLKILCIRRRGREAHNRVASEIVFERIINLYKVV